MFGWNLWENKEFSYGRCSKQKSFHELYDGLKNID